MNRPRSKAIEWPHLSPNRDPGSVLLQVRRFEGTCEANGHWSGDATKLRSLRDRLVQGVVILRSALAANPSRTGVTSPL